MTETMRWENLNIQQQNAFEDIAKKHQYTLLLVKLVADTGCFMCSNKPKSWSEFEFHLKSTHGIDRELILLFAETLKNERNLNIF